MAGTWSTPVMDALRVPGREPAFATVDFTFVADDSDGTVPDLALTAPVRAFMKGGLFYLVEVIPSATPWTALSGATLEDAYGDVLGGALGSMAQTYARVKPLLNGVKDAIPYDGRALTLKVTQAATATNEASMTLRLYIWRA